MCLSLNVWAIDLNEVQIRWSSVYQKKVDTKYITEEAIVNPAGARVVLAQLDLFTTNFRSISDCLVFEVPSKESAGTLLIIEKPIGKKCDDVKFRKSFFEFKNIYNFRMKESTHKLKLFIDRDSVSFNFFNTIDDNIKSSTADHQYKIPGTMVSFIQNPISKPVLKNYDICSDVPNEQCESSSPNLCHLCPQGKSYLVIASNCKKSIRRYCGEKKCGLPNMPACIRGRAATDYSGPFCIADSPMAFCEKPARVVCLNNELYCR